MSKAAKKDQKVDQDVQPEKVNTRKGPREYTSAAQDKLLDSWAEGQACELDMLNNTWVPARFVGLNGVMMCTVKLEDGTTTRVGRKFVRLPIKK